MYENFCTLRFSHVLISKLMAQISGRFIRRAGRGKIPRVFNWKEVSENELIKIGKVEGMKSVKRKNKAVKIVL